MAELKPIIIEYPVLGWGKDFSQSNSTAIEAREGQYSQSTSVSLYRPGFLYHIAPGETFTALTDASTRVNGNPLNGVVSSTGEAFVYIDTARVVQFGITDFVIDAHRQVTLSSTSGETVDHSAHTSLSGTDCDVLNYKNATNEYILYSWNDATDGDVGRMLKDGSSPDDNWLSGLATQTNGSVLTTGVPHRMKIGPDGSIYITNGQYIAYHAPNSTAVNYQKLDLGYGWIATDLDIDGLYLIISAYKATVYTTSYSYGDSKVFYWDTIKTSYNFPIDLQDNYVSALQTNNGDVYAFTYGRNLTTKVKLRKGDRFVTIFESAQIGSAPLAGATDVFQNVINYGSAGNIYVVDGEAFHHRTASGDIISMVKNLSQNILFIGRKSGSDYTIQKISFSGYASASFRTRRYILPYKSNIDKIIVYPSLIASGGSIQLSLFKDFNDVSIGGATDLLNATLSFATYGNVSSINVPMNKITDVNSLYLVITLSSAIVRRVEIYTSTTDKA